MPSREREALKVADNERVLAEAAAAKAEERAEAEARQTEIGNRVSRIVADEAARKARQA
ncbi:hypothetical protein RFM68_15665 [Mesorhizobium sp. MSK_1335]|uniref:Uncharacterized protein n=1 Tax=Mesorhizobium montanum TaxID=3072323 RepID=A0ABU4ZPN9_9HYPH|nr:hypothetical protein [Mesorhizobium sp. MSK_1335]MDX8525941.1 hypothetical protein [Mesorhizobium sp. MSK_1335]